MGTRGHPPGAGASDVDRAASAAVLGRAARRHAAGPPDAGPSEADPAGTGPPDTDPFDAAATAPVRVELPAVVAAPDAVVWRLLADAVGPVHLGVDGVVLAFAVPGTPQHGVGAQTCVVRRLASGFVTELSEVVALDVGRSVALRWLSAPTLRSGFAIEPCGPLTSRVVLWAEADVPATAADAVTADLRRAAARAVWELRDLVGDPAVAGTTAPPASAALLQQLGQPRAATGFALTLELREPHAVRRELDVAAPVDVVWRLLVATDTPVAHAFDPQARRFTVPGTPVERAGALMATTSRHRDGSVVVSLDEIVDMVAPTDLTVASFASAAPRALMIHLTPHEGGCRVEAEMAHDRCSAAEQTCAARAGGRLEHYLERIRRHAVGEPDLVAPR